MTNEEAHRLAREKGVSRPLYALVKAILRPLFRVYFRMHVSGVEHVPKEGAAIVAPNHKSFWDSFFLGIAIRGRHLRFMGKTELFEGRRARLLVRLGAFPVRRGRVRRRTRSRPPARSSARAACWPCSRRARGSATPTSSATPSAAPGRLALESGAPLDPGARSPAPTTCSSGRSPSPSASRWPSPSRSR